MPRSDEVWSLQILRARRAANSHHEARCIVYSQVYPTELLLYQNEAQFINTSALLDSDNPQSGAVSLSPDSFVRGRDLSRRSLLLTGGENGAKNATLVGGVASGLRLPEDKGSAEDRSSRERMEAFINAVFNKTISSNHHPDGKTSTSLLGDPSADPTYPARGSIRWPIKDSGLLDGLRRFTSVEVLEGENAFACKHCWEDSQRQRYKSVQGSKEFREPVLNLNSGSKPSTFTSMQADSQEQPRDSSRDHLNQPSQDHLGPSFGETGKEDSSSPGLRQEKISIIPLHSRLTTET